MYNLTRYKVGSFDRSVKPSIEFMEEIIMLSMQGLTLKECGDYYAQDAESWAEYCDENKILYVMHDCGIARGIALAGRQLIEQIKAQKLDAIKFYLKTQGSYVEKSQLTIDNYSTPTHIPPPPVPTDAVEASKLYQQFMKDS